MAYNDRHPKPPTPIHPPTPPPPKEPTPPGNLHDNMEKQSIPFEHNILRMQRLYSFNGFSLYWICICTDGVQLIWNSLRRKIVVIFSKNKIFCNLVQTKLYKKIRSKKIQSIGENTNQVFDSPAM